MKKKQDIEPRNEHGQYHGLCITYYINGNIMHKRRYVNGERHGLCEYYWGNGELYYKDYYNQDKRIYQEWYSSLNRIKINI